jgi:ribosomal protein L37AE/L43A
MAKNQKIMRQPKRYECEKCGRMTAVKHEKGRFRCLECNSYFGPKSKKGCYTQKEYLVLKTLFQLFAFLYTDERNNKKLTLKDFVKMVEKQNIDDVKKLVEVNVINKLDTSEQIKLTETDLEDVLVVTRDAYNRFRVYKNLFKPNKNFVFCDKTLKVENHGRYGSTNLYYKLRKEI